VKKKLLQSNIAIVGGGGFCRVFLQFLKSSGYADNGPRILGVADIDENAAGMVYAGELGIFTTSDYRELYHLKALEVILELTNDHSVSDMIRRTKPERVEFIDHISMRSIWFLLQMDVEKARVLKELRKTKENPHGLENLFSKFADRLAGIAKVRGERYKQIELNLIESERVLAQIVQGSTIPTFVINRDHVVTHWNKACEKLTGYSGEGIVGTQNQWKPFRPEERPIMADFILAGETEEEVWRYYGTKWRKSALIEGAYEAEEYFPHLGGDGKWLFFTAAPIKAPDGSIVGAIETLWDKTADKKAEEERERHNRELAAKAEELLASERAMAQIIQGSTVPTFVINKDHVITHWNKALGRLTDCPPYQMIGTALQWTPFWDDERPTMADAVLDQLSEEKIRELYGSSSCKSVLIDDAYEAEGYFPRLGEDGKWCFFTAAPIKAPDGTITGAIETFWDRTESKIAEEQKERHLTEVAGLCSFYTALGTSLDFDLRIKAGVDEIQNFMSTESICVFLRELSGDLKLRCQTGTSKNLCRKGETVETESIVYQVDQSGKLTIYNKLPDFDLEEIRRLKRESIKSVAYIPISTKERKAFGVVRLGSQYLDHFSSEEKNILELIGNRLGVAIENSMLHEQYIKSEEKYRSLFNNDPNPIFIIDSGTLEILDTNQRAQDCYGYSRNELFRMPFLLLGDEEDEEMAEGLKRIATDQSILFSKKKHYKNGRIPFYVNISVSYAKYSESDVLIATTTDITESIEKETQLIQAGKMSTLGQMASGIAHEINQPLNVIQVCADFFIKMVKKGERIPDEDLKTLANDINSNVQRASGIIKHMRDFARQSDVVRHKVNINAPIEDVFKVMGHQLKMHRVEVVYEPDPDMPDIMADHNRLEQVFVNLVANAIDAMEEKAGQSDGEDVEKQLTVKSFFENGFVTVTVSDTGTGMAPEVMNKIFEPFFTTKEVGKGTGLGVSISYGIVKDCGGVIEIESEVGKGTQFKLKFPALNSVTSQ